MKILIIRFSSIGDIVLTTPILRCLKLQKDADIHFLTKEEYTSVLRNNPYINKLHVLKKGKIKALQEENFDLIIDLHKNLRSFRVRSRLNAPVLSFDKRNVRKWLLARFKTKTQPISHIVGRYFAGVKSLGLIDDGKGLDFFVDPEIKDKFKNLKIPIPYYCLVLGANYHTKRIPIEVCKKIIQNLNIKVVLIGGKDTASIGKELNELYPESVINMAGRINLQESALFLKDAKHVITGDTGMMHIATSFQKPMTVLWGSTIPEFGMYPYYGSKSKHSPQNLIVSGLSCQPCSKLGYDACPKGHFQCMMDQEVSEIPKFG